MIEYVLAAARRWRPLDDRRRRASGRNAETARWPTRPGLTVRGAGTTARDRACAADDGRRPRRSAAARSSCCRATCRSCRPTRSKALVDRTRSRRRGRDGRHGYRRQPARLRAHRRGHGGQIARIVEEKDASPAERAIREINSGIYAFALDGLFDAVRAHRGRERAARVLPADLVAIYRQAGPDGRNRDRLESPTRFAASTAASSWRR